MTDEIWTAIEFDSEAAAELSPASPAAEIQVLAAEPGDATAWRLRVEAGRYYVFQDSGRTLNVRSGLGVRSVPTNVWVDATPWVQVEFDAEDR